MASRGFEIMDKQKISILPLNPVKPDDGDEAEDDVFHFRSFLLCVDLLGLALEQP